MRLLDLPNKIKTSNSEVRLSLNKITKKLINNQMTDILTEKLVYLLMKGFTTSI